MEHLPFIDWTVAARTGRRLVAPGPELAPRQIADVVASLRAAAVEATAHVGEVSRLREPADSGVLVVDRASWISANASMAAAMLSAGGAPATPASALERMRGRAVGAQAGAVLALVGTRILGQFDAFSSPQRLLLVAPNIVAVERQLKVNPADFRLWVCLHEETHRFQFGQAPWLREHLLALLGQLLTDDGPLSRLGGGHRRGSRLAGLGDLFSSPEQRAVFDQVTAVMSLMEGHADVMMDRVGTSVIPTLPAIRRAFENRRDRQGWPALVQKLLGLDLKRAQYRDGAAFCRAVIGRVGVDGLNRVFEGPDLVPTLTEIHGPQQWLQRVGL